MKGIALTALLLSIVTIPATAGDFSISAEELGSAILKTTISSLNLSQHVLKLMILTNNTSEVQTSGYLFQNLWGIIYGGVVLAGWQNKITSLVFEEIKDNPEHYNEFGVGLNNLGANATVIFGDPQGTKGLAKVLSGTVSALNNSSRLYNSEKTLLEAYAESIALSFHNSVYFLLELMKAIPKAFPSP